jgi:hypothetical protein
MKSNVGSFRLWAGLVSVCIASCAQGAPAAPMADILAPVPVMEPNCGNGKFEPALGEMCDCENKDTTTQCVVPDKTCAMLINGSSGQVLCEAKKCIFNLSMCKGGIGPVAGIGAGAAGIGR